MNSSKLLVILMALVTILAAFMYYLFTNSKPKDISFVDKNATQIEEQIAMSEQNATNQALNENTKAQTLPKQDFANKQKATRQGVSTPTKTQTAQSTQKASVQGSLRSEYNALIARSKRDTSLGEPRYSVYVLDGKKPNAKEKAVINEIVRTLSNRGGYLRYSLFVDKISDENMKIYLFNENLLDNAKWRVGGLSLPHLWFKFNQNTMQSIKNSFHIKNLKRDISGYKLRSVVFSGHTDEIGGEFYNSMLGLKRTAAVASEFLRITGKITLQSYGKNAPVSKGLSENERYKNRRVETKFE